MRWEMIALAVMRKGGIRGGLTWGLMDGCLMYGYLTTYTQYESRKHQQETRQRHIGEGINRYMIFKQRENGVYSLRSWGRMVWCWNIRKINQRIWLTLQIHTKHLYQRRCEYLSQRLHSYLTAVLQCMLASCSYADEKHIRGTVGRSTTDFPPWGKVGKVRDTLIGKK